MEVLGEDTAVKRFAATLRRLRVQSGMSMSGLAGQVGSTEGTIGAYERQYRVPPLPQACGALAPLGHALAIVPVDAAAREVDYLVAQLVAACGSRAAAVEALYGGGR